MLKQRSVISVSLLALAFILSGCATRTYVVEETVIVPIGEARNVTVFCEEGDLALSGGYRTGQDMVPSHYEPRDDENPRGWRFIFANPRNYDVNVAYEVLCLDTSR
jgi:hypothetical protein